MMIGPMKKKVVTSSVITAIVLILIFAGLAFIYISNNNKQIAELKKKSEVVQRYVFARNMLKGDVVTANDVTLVDVKGESAPTDSYAILSNMIGNRLKVNANERTIVTKSLFFEEDKEPAMDTRLLEFNMIALPSNLNVGDYIDVRILLATGEDYLVLVGKKVESFGSSNGEGNTIFLRLNEEEIVGISSAIIESYIRDGVKLYANKYVDPDTQLFTYNRVNFVDRFENARYGVAENVENNVSGENASADTIGEKYERAVSEIAGIIGLSVEETENIKVALDTNDEDTLNFYRDKLLVSQKSIKTNYPVKLEVANLIQNNPNLLADVKAKYNVEKLEQERINFLDTELTEIDDMTGKLEIKDEYLSKINEKLQNEITIQKTERQEYLLDLLAKQNATTTTEEK